METTNMMLPSRLLQSLSGSVLSASVLLFACLLCCGCGSPKVSWENFKRVEKGMTIQQVERILGPGKDGRYPADEKEWAAFENYLKSNGIPANAVWKHWPDPAQTEKDVVYNIAFVHDKVVGVITHSIGKK
jgi:hypothetical protein